MTTDQIKLIQNRIGAVPDGVWGAKSRNTAREYLKRMMPPIDRPRDTDKELEAFFGKPGTNLTRIDVTGYGVLYDGNPVRSIQCNALIAEPLYDAIRALYMSEYRWILGHYGGCYNNRPRRGGTRLSTHAYGAAIDLWPVPNGNRTPWPQKALMPFEVMEIFAYYGFVPAGAFWGRDATHFQFTQP
jgi:hypothetical protein